MADELTYPILPCRLLDDVVPFYEALGFEVTYRQDRPYGHLVVRRQDIRLHFCQPEGFDPAQSYGSVIVIVPDANALYRSFAEGLRAVYGRLPSAGIPRILRPRKKLGTVAGFSVIDPGGNWLRVYRAGDSEEGDGQEKPRGLALALRSAARQGDSRGNHALAVKMLDAALARHAAAPASERLPALVYRAELAVRMDDQKRAATALAEIKSLDLDVEAQVLMAADLQTAAEIERDLP